MNKKYLLLFIIIVVGIVIAGVFLYINQSKTESGEEGIISAQEAVQKALGYINKNLLQGDAKASLIEATEENGVYKFRIKIEEQQFESYVTKDGKLLFVQPPFDLESEPQAQTPQEEKEKTIGDFSISEDEVCKENGKPIIYFFGSEGCSHCKWEHPIVESVTKNFGEYISFHNNMDSSADMDVFSKYSTGSIPTLVLGCKYYRVGSGEETGKEEESKVLTALICKLTQNQPAGICSEVQDLINQIKEE